MMRIFLITLLVFAFEFSFCQEYNSFTDYIEIYQKGIGPSRISNCQMYPSCSNYGLQAFKNNNPLIATFQTSDRLMRCSHDHVFYGITEVDNKFRLIDLPNRNDSIEKELQFGRSTITFPNSISSDTSEVDFINYLMLERNYREALLEINRLFYYGKDRECIDLYVNLIRCKRSLNEMEDAIFKYNNSFPSEVKKHSRVEIEIGNCYQDMGIYDEALKHYEFAEKLSDSTENDRPVMLQSLSYTFMKDFDKAKSCLLVIPKTSTFHYDIAKAITVLEKHPQGKYKSKFVAGSLGIVPGLGYLYSGHKMSAVSSLFINSLLGFATYSNIEKENYGMAALTGFFSFSFYLGNIYGSVKSVNRFNDRINKKTIQSIKSIIYY